LRKWPGLRLKLEENTIHSCRAAPPVNSPLSQAVLTPIPRAWVAAGDFAPGIALATSDVAVAIAGLCASATLWQIDFEHVSARFAPSAAYWRA